MEPSLCSNQSFRLLSTEYPIYIAKRNDRWDLGRRLVAEIDWSLLSEEINDVYKEPQHNMSGTLGDIRIYVAPCKRQISTAISVCVSILLKHKLIDCYIRVDDRLSTSCCSRPAISERLKSLLSELKEGYYSRSRSFDQRMFETIDRLWLEQRLDEIECDTDSETKTYKTQLSDHLRSVYDCTGLTKPLAAILLIGEPSLITKIMNTQPFHASPRIPRPNEFFKTQCHYTHDMKGGRHIGKFLGSIDVNPAHRKVQAPMLPVSQLASLSSLKRSPTTDLGEDSYVKHIDTQSEPDSEDIYH